MTSAPPPAFEDPIGLAIIGAGLAGISAGRLARRQGVTPLIFDKGRGIGGRLATRRATLDDGTVLRFDHGAQFMTARSPALVASAQWARWHSVLDWRISHACSYVAWSSCPV